MTLTQPFIPIQFLTVEGGSFIQCACTHPDTTVLILGDNTTLLLAGAFSFQLLYGCVDVDGYIFHSKKFNSSNFVRIAVPTGHLPVLFKIRGELSEELNKERIQSRLREFVNDPRKVFPFVEEKQPIAILLVKAEMDIASRFIQQQQITKMKSQQLFSHQGRTLAKNLHCLNVQNEQYIDPEEFKKLGELYSNSEVVHQKICSKLQEKNKCIVFIAGNKGVGKSTLMRFLINAVNTRSCETRRRVFLLDIDVGQSELCPPGCVSLFEVNKPLIGSPFAHQETTLLNSYFFGSNSPSVDFDFYIKLVERALNLFHTSTKPAADDEQFVLVVNSLGWIEELGYDLMLRILGTVKPSILVNLDMKGIINFTVPDNYRSITLTIKRTPGQIQGQFSAKPSQLRNFLSVGYLSHLFQQIDKPFASAKLRLAELVPYRVRFKSAAIYVHPEIRYLSDKMMLNALNLAIVALCKVEDGFEKCFERRPLFDDSSLPSRLELRPDGSAIQAEPDQSDTLTLGDDEEIRPIERQTMPMLRCFGFGLIRAISPQRKLFYLLTPVDQRILPQVNVFALGHCLNTPELIFDTNLYEASPYVVELDSELHDQRKKLFSPLRIVTATKRGFFGSRNGI